MSFPSLKTKLKFFSMCMNAVAVQPAVAIKILINVNFRCFADCIYEITH